MRPPLAKSLFVNRGRCSEHTPVHGIMAPSSYNPSATAASDVWNVSCAGGWTGGNYVGAATDVARYTYEVYAPRGTVVGAASKKLMTNFTGDARCDAVIHGSQITAANGSCLIRSSGRWARILVLRHGHVCARLVCFDCKPEHHSVRSRGRHVRLPVTGVPGYVCPVCVCAYMWSFVCFRVCICVRRAHPRSCVYACARSRRARTSRSSTSC